MRKLFALLCFCALPVCADLTVSDGERFATLKLFVKDSLQIGKYHEVPYRVQNTMAVGLFLNGLAAPNFSFNAFAEVNTDKAHGLTYPPHDFEPYLGYPYVNVDKQSNSKGRTWDFFRARIDWQAAPYFKISSGYDYLSYGPARHNKLTLRGGDFYWRAIQDTADYAYIGRPVPTPFIGWDLSIAFVSYSQDLMLLKNWRDNEKFLHAHRLDFKVSDAFSFGLTETVVYGGDGIFESRNIEPIYLLPFVPYLFAESYGGDRDNNGMSADFSWKLFKKFELYGELFIDDLDGITSFFDESWWGNKWAVSLGVAIDSAKIGMFNWDCNFEYTRIEPWVYTHHKGAGTNYSNFGNSLGSDLGPNAREIYSRMGFSFRELVRLDFSVSGIAKDTAFGSRISDVHTYMDATDKKYLNSESTLHYQEYGFGLLYRPFSIWSIGAKQYWIFGEYKGKRTEVFSGVVW